MSPIRFTIEQRHLTNATGQPVADLAAAVNFHVCDAASIDDAVAQFAAGHSAQIIGSVLKSPGFQGMATLRNPTGVFTLQIAPASHRIPIKS